MEIFKKDDGSELIISNPIHLYEPLSCYYIGKKADGQCFSNDLFCPRYLEISNEKYEELKRKFCEKEIC